MHLSKTTSLTLGVAAVAGLSFASLAQAQCGGCSGDKSLDKTAYQTVANKETKDIVGTAVAAGKFKTLAAALQAAGLVDALQGDGPFTVFAPTDEAFAKLPEGTVESLLKPENKGKLTAILTYHVVPGKVTAADVVKLSGAGTLNGQRLPISVDGDAVSIGDASVAKADVMASNGVIHVIDTVLLPADKNVVETAISADDFNTLVAAVNAAGLAEALSGEGPFTVFAPTDAAFAKLPEGTLDSLLKPENKDKLAAILKYHVIPGRVYSDAVVKGAEAKTLQGSTVNARVADGKPMIQNAGIVKTDIDTTNGVIHVIDTVILPPSDEKSKGEAGSHADHAG